MNESQFNSLVDKLLFNLEEALDESGLDIDFESSSGVMSITCENNGSQIIVSRQPSLGEVWVAAKSGGFHLAKNAGDEFICQLTGESFDELLSRVLSEQCNEPVSLKL